MARLIDADALKECLKEYCVDGDSEATKWYEMMGIDEEIDDAPTVDAAEVVRCRDCRYCDGDEPEHPFCEKLNEYCKNFEWYCADAVKKGRPIEVQLEELAKGLGDIMRAVESLIDALDGTRKEVENADSDKRETI